MTLLGSAMRAVENVEPRLVVGRVDEVRGLTMLVEDLPLAVGSLVEIGGDRQRTGSGAGVPGEIVGFRRDRAIVMPLGATAGVRPGDAVCGLEQVQSVRVGPDLLGRCINGLGRPIDGLGPVRGTVPHPLEPPPLAAMERRPITEPLETGVRAIDLMTTLGRGQRLGIFAGPGVGKSTLLGDIARRCASDVNVIALIGERGREVRDFIERSLGPEGLARSVVVVATGDESPLLRLRAAKAACAVAEYFREQGRDVMLMMDSVTRFAHASRQVGLSVGEPPATKGYTPSVFSAMAQLLERAGSVESSAGGGSITGLYTILVEGDDMTEPVADAARGILDGHLVLSRRLARKGHFPAVDVLDSVSRVADEICDETHVAARRRIAGLLASYAEVEELVQIGAYARGSSPDSDVALDFESTINDLLRQGRDDASTMQEARSLMVKIAMQAEDTLRNRRASAHSGEGEGR